MRNKKKVEAFVIRQKIAKGRKVDKDYTVHTPYSVHAKVSPFLVQVKKCKHR